MLTKNEQKWLAQRKRLCLRCSFWEEGNRRFRPHCGRWPQEGDFHLGMKGKCIFFNSKKVYDRWAMEEYGWVEDAMKFESRVAAKLAKHFGEEAVCRMKQARLEVEKEMESDHVD